MHIRHHYNELEQKRPAHRAKNVGMPDSNRSSSDDRRCNGIQLHVHADPGRVRA
jgi:hypothetical protein